MIEVLAIVAADPMSWPVLAVLTLAAGMYPLGFMFGVCSECCQGCAGSLCHFHEIDGYAFRPIPLYPNIAIEVSLDSVSTDEVEYETNWVTIGTKSVSITGTFSGGSATATSVRYRYIMDQQGNGLCGLTDVTARYYIWFEALFEDENGGEVLLVGTPQLFTEDFFLFESGECASYSDTIELSNLQWGTSGGSGSIEDNILSYLGGLSATVSISFDACECGACCGPNGGGCTDQVAEHLCSEDNGGFWVGVGTDCDPDPC